MGIWIIAGVVLILALCLVQAIGALLPVNLFTVAVCGILGLPGAISLLVCNLMW